ncbi:hypothetical protein [Candidatus Nitrosotenuis sp. DW1]|uniref:hypothetical protein n=1 Tax=Candidatus Nitrosotenuis sp. DW1 TaxID=2259672 RepID=UPI0015C88B1B|nr:hypothetical protein [Candidatus Nitrosotenuis sp. DW1]QLH09811.1 hypothetical protein DSQ19_10375 [Candidatus Nitrosotenuis sp. DW1]
MYDDLVKEAIRGQTADSASAIMQSTVPSEVKGFIPDLVSQLDQGVDPSDVADQALNKTFDIVQSSLLGDASNHVIDKFGHRIVDLLFGAPFLNILQKASLLISNSTNPF